MANLKSPVKSSKQRTSKPKAVEGNAQLTTFFINSRKDIYRAEKSIGHPLVKSGKSITTGKLHELITELVDQSAIYVGRVEDAFGIVGTKAQARMCIGGNGLIKENEAVYKETPHGSMTRDFAMVTGVQK